MSQHRSDFAHFKQLAILESNRLKWSQLSGDTLAATILASTISMISSTEAAT